MKAGDSISKTFSSTSGSGALTNADSVPAVTVYRNAVLTAIVVTVTSIATGVYSYSFTIPIDWIVGDNIDIHVSAVVNSQQVNTKKNLGELEAVITGGTLTPLLEPMNTKKCQC